LFKYIKIILIRGLNLTDKTILDNIFLKLSKLKFTIAIAESCTGGLIAHTLTNISGSSDYFDRGIVTYSNRAKIELLDVSEEILKQKGAVSFEVAKKMAEGVRKKSKVDIGISTTGIAGPTGGTKEKPVGLVFIGISTKKETIVKKFQFKGNRLQNKESTCNEALKLLLDLLDKW
jgi:PncC family amidohydrolase